MNENLSQEPQDMWPQNEPTLKKTSAVWIVIFIVLALIIGFIGGFYYYRFSNPTYSIATPSSTKSTSSTPTTTSSTSSAASSTTSSDNWQENAKKTVDAYLVGIHNTLDPQISGNTKQKFSSSTESDQYLQKYTTTALNTYLTCIKDYEITKNDIILNAQIDGTQDGPSSYSFGAVTKTGDTVTVVVNEQFSPPHVVSFYLIKENNQWLINSTSALAKIDATKTGCKQP